MADPTSAGPPGSMPERLDSWKDIAAYLKRDVSTVQRWEKREGMPVHRHLHDKLGSVYAYPAELDAWARSRRPVDAQRADGSVEGAREPTPMVQGKRRPLALPAIIALALVAAAAAGIWFLRSGDAPRTSPIATARFTRLTDFEGTEQAAAISRDGRFVAFLSDRDGAIDVWLTQIGSGQFRNLTSGRLRELVNPDVRLLGFSPDGTLVTVWVRQQPGSDISVWAVPTLGGEPRRYLESAAELEWSADGTKLVYHTPAPGDPMFVRDAAGGEPRALFTAAEGIHNHYPVWSPDDEFIYFVHGHVPGRQDIWRIPTRGGTLERLTKHDTRVSHLAFLDERRLLYLATDSEGEGPWLYALDVKRRTTRRISFGVERYGSLSISADGHRLAVTVADVRRTLWRVPIGAAVAGEAAAERMQVAVVGVRSPRVARDFLLYVSSRTTGESIWKVAGGTAAELWAAPGARIIGGPAISPDGRRVAFSASQNDIARLYVINADGSGVRAMPPSLAPRGAPAWSPDGASIVVSALQGGSPALMRVALNDQQMTVVRPEFAEDPVWSPDGRSVVYSGLEVGTTFPIRVTGLDGQLRSRSDIRLSRGVRRIVFLPGQNAIVVLRGDMIHKNFWAVDLETGQERQLTNFGPGVVIGDFDVSPDGREIVFDREQQVADVVLIER